MNARYLSDVARALAAVLLISKAAVAQPAQTTVQLTLADAVHRVIEHNPDLAIVGLDTEVEATRVGETRGAFPRYSPRRSADRETPSCQPTSCSATPAST